MRDEEHRSGERGERLFEPFDRRDVEMVGRLVEEQQVGLEHERPRERHALAQPAGQLLDERVRGKLQPVERGFDAMLRRPRVRRVERFVQRVHALHLTRVCGGQ